MMQYGSLPPMSREEAESNLESDSKDAACAALLSLSNDPTTDSQWMFVKCEEFCQSNDYQRVMTGILAIGHLARTQHRLDIDAINTLFSRLRPLHTDYEGRIADALDDIRIYQ